ncbi:hypothetical protein [Methanospirillum lacunae]|uniref:hypothetical protein n=1 Tax=Methanospirillum lacunae TaxID=668570 RepID=UPI0011B26F45|nr:hypothetical protein [Methanospirillum lacunae]
MTRRSENLEREEPIGWVEINDEDAKAQVTKSGEMVKQSVALERSRLHLVSLTPSRRMSCLSCSTLWNVQQICLLSMPLT